MSAQVSTIAQILLVFIFLNWNCVLGIRRDQKSNSTSSEDSYYDTERDSRQYVSGASYPGPFAGGVGDYGLSSFGGPTEAIIIGLLVVAALGIVGIPFLLLFFQFFNGGNFGGIGTNLGGVGGLNLVPTTTTTVAGRKRRDINSLLPEVNPMVQQKLYKIFDDFVKTPDKIKLIEKLLDSMVGRN